MALRFSTIAGSSQIMTCLCEFLCKLHRKDPGCVVGEHEHVRFEACDFGLGVAFFEAIE